jgi:hypothetical protein
MSALRKLIAALLALILTLASTALIFAPVAMAHPAPVAAASQPGSSAGLRHGAGGEFVYSRD